MSKSTRHGELTARCTRACASLRRSRSEMCTSSTLAGPQLGDLALRQALDVPHPDDLRPLLYAKQRLPPVSIVRSSQINGPVGHLRPRAAGGPLLLRRRRTSIQAAPTPEPQVSECQPLEVEAVWPKPRRRDSPTHDSSNESGLEGRTFESPADDVWPLPKIGPGYRRRRRAVRSHRPRAGLRRHGRLGRL
jgi:hypothetical protein